MEQRIIQYHIYESGEVSPAIPQYGGLKGEHNMTKASFILPYTLYKGANAVRLGLRYGDGAVVSTDLLEPLIDEATNHVGVSLVLPKFVTMAGGQLELRLILSHIDENGTETALFQSDAAVVYFEDAAVENGTPFWTGVSELLKGTVSASGAARTARDEAQSHATTAMGYARTAQVQAQNADAARQAAEDARDKAQEIADNITVPEGANGKDGVGIASIEETESIGDGTQILSTLYEIHLTDGSSYEIEVNHGINGKDGVDGTAGKDGEDYVLTDADKAEIADIVITELQGLPVFGIVDENNVVTVTSQLTAGTYTLKYEYEDGSLEEVGTITVGNGGVVEIVNLLETAVGAQGTVLNDVGYADGYYLSGSASVNGNNSFMGTDAACFATGFMPYTKAQLTAGTPIYVKGVVVDKTLSHVRICYYPSYDYAQYLDPIKLSSSYFDVTELGTNYYKITPINVDGILTAMAALSDIAYVRLSLNGSGEGVIITAGQEIPV